MQMQICDLLDHTHFRYLKTVIYNLNTTYVIFIHTVKLRLLSSGIQGHVVQYEADRVYSIKFKKVFISTVIMVRTASIRYYKLVSENLQKKDNHFDRYCCGTCTVNLEQLWESKVLIGIPVLFTYIFDEQKSLSSVLLISNFNKIFLKHMENKIQC